MASFSQTKYFSLGRSAGQCVNSIRSLLNTATNYTPHERFFTFQKRPGTIRNKILPSWLITPGTVLLKNYGRYSKNDALAKQVDLGKS